VREPMEPALSSVSVPELFADWVDAPCFGPRPKQGASTQSVIGHAPKQGLPNHSITSHTTLYETTTTPRSNSGSASNRSATSP